MKVEAKEVDVERHEKVRNVKKLTIERSFCLENKFREYFLKLAPKLKAPLFILMLVNF